MRILSPPTGNRNPAALIDSLKSTNLKTKTQKWEYFTGPGAAARSANMFNISEAGCVTELMFICNNSTFMFDGLIEIYCDGAADGSPTVLIPFGQLVGMVNTISFNTAAAYVVNATNLKIGNGRWSTPMFDLEYLAYSTQGVGAIGGFKLILRLPIPYSKGIRAKLYSLNAASSTNYWGDVKYTEEVTSPLRLKGQGGPTFTQATSLPNNYTAHVDPDVNKDLFTLAAGNAGWLVAHWLTQESAFFNTDGAGNTILERNIFFFRDQESTASVQSSGMEDYFGGAFYYTGDTQAQLTAHSFTPLQRFAGYGGGTCVYHGTTFLDLFSKYSGGLSFTNGCILRSMGNVGVGEGGTITANPIYMSFILYYQ